MTDNQKLKKAGWTKVKINDKWWWVDPETEKKYRASHAIMVLSENQHQEEIKQARLAEEEYQKQARELVGWDPFEHPIEELFPKEKEHADPRKLRTSRTRDDRRGGEGLPHGYVPKVAVVVGGRKKERGPKGPSGGKADSRQGHGKNPIQKAASRVHKHSTSKKEK